MSHEDDRHRLRRRLRTFSALTIVFSLPVVGMPLWLLATLSVDVVRRLAGRRFSFIRLYAFGLVYCGYELIGLSRLLWAWALYGRQPRRMVSHTYRIQAWWAGGLFDAACRIFDLRVHVEGQERWSPGPVVVLFRHVSLLDTLLPAALNRGEDALALRYVLKHELLNLPCLDVAGNILPNAFVRRDGDDSDRERAKVAALGRQLDAGSGVLIYPEGTRFTKAKLEYAMQRLGQGAPERADRLARLTRVLPIRPGGVLALLQNAPLADIVVVGHRGLEGLHRLTEMVWGGLVGRRICIDIRRYTRSEMPIGQELAWLDSCWLALDESLARPFTKEGAEG